MTTKKDIIILYILIFLEFLILINSKTIIISINKGTNMFITKIFPSIFPTMVLGTMLIKCGINKIIPKFIKKIFNKLFNFDDNMTSIYIMSMLTGTPGNSIYINEYQEKGLINEKTAEYLAYTTHFINPLFVIGTVGIGIFNDIKIGILILLMLYLSNFIKTYILRKNFIPTNKKELINNETIIKAFTLSIKQSITTILTIFGIVILFNMLTTLITEIFNLSNISSFIINTILEMTGGVTKLSSLNINIPLKILIAYFSLTFGGLCIHMQYLSILNNKKIRYLKYLILRVS